MSNLLGVLSTAQSGLLANSAAIAVAGENITGANTPGFSRRTAQLENRSLSASTAGGVTVAGVTRAFDQFSTRALISEQSLWGAADARASAMNRAEGVLQPGDGFGLDDRFGEFFQSWQELANKPDDLALRRDVIVKSQALVQTFNSMSHDVEAIRSSLYSEAQTVVDEVNVRLEKINVLNNKVVSTSKETSGRAEIMDERDRLIREVSERISINVVEHGNGSVALLSSGVALLDAGVVRSLAVSLQPYDASTPADPRTALKFEATLPNGTPRDITTRVTGGRLAGLREARDSDLIDLAADLDALAYDFATEANTRHAAGVDLDGNVPPDLFVGGLGPIPAPPGTAAGLLFNVAIDADRRLLGAASALNPPPGGNEIALSLAAIQQASLAAQGTPAERVAQIAAKTGNKVVSAESELRLRESTRSHAEQMREESSGVSLDEEMINLTKFQRAFQASTRVLQVADQLLQELVEKL